MNDENTSTDNQAVNRDVWPRKLNKVLIGIGVLAFGLIIADRLVDMNRADDLSDVVELTSDTDSQTDTVVPQPPVIVETGNTETEVFVNMEDVFDSRLVFVSASEPKYVITDNDRRIDVGNPIDEDTKLAGITSQGVIVDKAGNLLVVRLPEPSMK